MALSSGEAELYAIESGAAEALFARSLVMEARLFATAGKSMAGRFGTSRKTKHVDLRFLYVQELVQTGMVKLRKVLGTLNPATRAPETSLHVWPSSQHVKDGFTSISRY